MVRLRVTSALLFLVMVTPTGTETILPLSLSKSHLPHFNDVALVQSNAVLVAVLQRE